MHIQLITALMLLGSFTFGQGQKYTNQRGDIHLAGLVRLTDITEDTLYAKWYRESYDAFSLSGDDIKWKKKLKDVEVDIYFGSWCGDSKNYVPKFVHAWNELGLDESQLTFIALYDGADRYKQGPNGEEQGQDIHRVPTFIFKRGGQEFARMVEFPRTSIERDLAQIALGFAPAPSYRAASYMQKLLKENSKEVIYENFRDYVRKIYEFVGKASELNTLGYVYLSSDRLDEALICFKFNTYFFPYNPNVYDSYAEGSLAVGDTASAIANYQKVLSIVPEDENATAQLKMLGVSTE